MEIISRLKITVLCDVMLCTLVYMCRHFIRTWFLHLYRILVIETTVFFKRRCMSIYPGYMAHFPRHVPSWSPPRDFLCYFFLEVRILCSYDTALWTPTQRWNYNNTRTCKYNWPWLVTTWRRWPSRVNIHTCNVIPLYRPTTHLHKSFILHNSACL